MLQRRHTHHMTSFLHHNIRRQSDGVVVATPGRHTQLARARWRSRRSRKRRQAEGRDEDGDVTGRKEEEGGQRCGGDPIVGLLLHGPHEHVGEDARAADQDRGVEHEERGVGLSLHMEDEL
jgi:hypothetical protein